MRVFDFASGRCLVVFAGHSDWYLCAFASPTSMRNLLFFLLTVTRVSCMQFDEKCIVTGSHDHEIKLYSFL
jgi:WD40 repeat protein